MADLLGADFCLAEPHKLYACHDFLLQHKADLFTHLVTRWRDLFNVDFDVLLYDLISVDLEIGDPTSTVCPMSSRERRGKQRVSRWQRELWCKKPAWL